MVVVAFAVAVTVSVACDTRWTCGGECGVKGRGQEESVGRELGKHEIKYNDKKASLATTTSTELCLLSSRVEQVLPN
jgi:hypothetical protein